MEKINKFFSIKIILLVEFDYIVHTFLKSNSIRPNPLGSRNKLYEQWRGGRALRFMKRTRETRRGIRLSVIAAKLRPIDKVKNLRWIYDVGRGGWSAAIARPCVVNRRWRGTRTDTAHTAPRDARHTDTSSRAITTVWKGCRFTGGKASTIRTPSRRRPRTICFIAPLKRLG